MASLERSLEVCKVEGKPKVALWSCVRARAPALRCPVKRGRRNTLWGVSNAFTLGFPVGCFWEEEGVFDSYPPPILASL